MKQITPNSKTRAWALTSASALVLGVAGVPFAPSMAFAQDEAAAAADDGDDDTIVVTGVRKALQSAQDIKQNADTIVDSITATDIGAFPDKSVAEALQRVAGITVNRFAASSDTAHFSAEPSGVIVRGLQQVRSEFNGRDSFSANSSRGLSWGDVSPELMAGVDTYKNQMAELIEGGIAGTVNLRTRVPFDSNGQLVALSANLNYGDISDRVTPEVSGIYSNRWDTSIGEFGFMGNFAHSEVTTKTNGAQLYRMNRFRDIDVDATWNGDPAYSYPNSLSFIPAAVNIRENIYYRERNGYALAGQWQDNDHKWLVTTQYNYSKYDNAWEEYLVQSAFADLSYGQDLYFENDSSVLTVPQPVPGTDFTWDENGLFQTGHVTTDSGWWGNPGEEATYATNADGEAIVNSCYDWNGCSFTQRSTDFNTVTRSNNNTNITQDASINIKYAPTDRMRFNFDYQHIESEVTNYDIEISMNSFAQAFVDISGKYPALELSSDPADLINVNLGTGGFTNPGNYRYNHIMDHVEDSSGEEDAVRLDGEFDFDNGWLKSLKVGGRWSKREQLVQWSGYNWQNVSNTWTQNGEYYSTTKTNSPCASDPSIVGCNGQAFVGYPTDVFQVRDFGNEHFSSLSPNQFAFFDMDLLQDQDRFASMFSADALGFSGGVGWDPICSNTGDRAAEVAGTCFTPAEIVDVSEETTAFYAQLNYGGPDAEILGFPISGNFGVRYVETINKSTGGITYPLLQAEYFVDPDGPRDVSNLDCETRTATDPSAPPPNPPGSMGCYLTQDIIDFANGDSELSTAEAEHEHWLPSFNLKVELNDEWFLRFAASRAMSRPDIGNMRNYVSVSQTLPDLDNAGDPLWVKEGGDIVAASARYSGSAQNPFLAPVMANQYDISLEHYFADVGSFSFTAFYKEFEDYIQFGTYNREFTNNGVTTVAEIRGPLNGEGASIQGFEVAYQRFFDFLPTPFDGLGLQANYTFIENNGISNSNLSNVGGDATTVTAQAPNRVEVDRLEGLSDHSYNIIGMYEKGPFAARLAYNWRSEYLTTAIDCCVAYAIWTEEQGFLDGSLRYAVNDNFELSLQGSNLLNTDTILYQQVTDASDGGLLLPNGYFQNDRRFTVGLRFKY